MAVDHFQQCERDREAARLGHEQQDVVARLGRALAQEIVEHREDRRRTEIAAETQVAVPALLRDIQLRQFQALAHDGCEALGGVMTQEMIDLRRIDRAGLRQLDVFVRGDVEQLRQQADVLAQQHRAGRVGLAEVVVVAP
jgi:hypothetical protein